MTHKEPVKKTARPGSTPGHRSSKAATRTASAGKDRVSDPSAKAVPSRRKTQSVRMKRMRRKKDPQYRSSASSAGRPVWSRGIWSLHVKRREFFHPG